MTTPFSFDDELARHRRAIEELAKAAEHDAPADASPEGAPQIDQHGVAIGHRANTLLVDMCGLVEAALGTLAVGLARGDPAQEARVRGLSRHGLSKFLGMAGAVEFNQLGEWMRFEQLCQVRNAIVHGFGGIVPTKRAKQLEGALRMLEMRGCFASSGQLRMNARSLMIAHKLVSSVLDDLLRQLSSRAETARAEAAVAPPDPEPAPSDEGR